jgi:hypothetical protein
MSVNINKLWKMKKQRRKAGTRTHITDAACASEYMIRLYVTQQELGDILSIKIHKRDQDHASLVIIMLRALSKIFPFARSEREKDIFRVRFLQLTVNKYFSSHSEQNGREKKHW